MRGPWPVTCYVHESTARAIRAWAADPSIHAAASETNASPRARHAFQPLERTSRRRNRRFSLYALPVLLRNPASHQEFSRDARPHIPRYFHRRFIRIRIWCLLLERGAGPRRGRLGLLRQHSLHLVDLDQLGQRLIPFDLRDRPLRFRRKQSRRHRCFSGLVRQSDLNLDLGIADIRRPCPEKFRYRILPEVSGHYRLVYHDPVIIFSNMQLFL